MAGMEAPTRTLPASDAENGGIAADEAPAVAEKDVSPAPDAVCCRAFEIYLAGSGGPGDAATDWIQAEHDLRSMLPGNGRRTKPVGGIKAPAGMGNRVRPTWVESILGRFD